MARLPEEIIIRIFNLQQQLLERIDEATATEFTLMEIFGETEATIDYLDQLQNARERADMYYSRLFTALRQIYPAQPVATRDNLELLVRFLAEAEATVDAIGATVAEIRRDFNL
ncbi:hypothetical protein Cri9333_0679 [Crinalium epipsammum PCC 9333]|uniref:Uncharacterized protein n=1 Tax=Crinalium epipsammum PCC 9333 TaxID=1173022 RepID=K9VVN0_9CYAN|nr:hypothetical protein [Crinalium epipsammum]AFZ11299.1 hypothetical protein Cri9333_0315 [Crinalium epipsammum PCC 9333]AFZ11614.1 hypothetical protein Cri9333_0679 [Crinalium epipsammum PCC 9333]